MSKPTRRPVLVAEGIEFEIEHELYLARIYIVPKKSIQSVTLAIDAIRVDPVHEVQIHYIPRYERVGSDIGDTAYRALYRVQVVVGMSHLESEIAQLIGKAQYLAEINPDPVEWRTR